MGLLFGAGCSGDARLADHEIRHSEVKTVSHYGVTLDKEASPEQVGYVLLRAIRDDVLAETDEARQSALDVQFDLCAANRIRQANRSSLSDDEFLYEVVRHWAPTISYYVDAIETEWESAKPRMRVGPLASPGHAAQGVQERGVFVQLADPSGDPNARVLLLIQVIRDETYWRVMQLQFDPWHRALPVRSTGN